MSDIEEDSEISFAVKFLGRLEVVRPDGTEILKEATAALENPDKDVSEKGKTKKSKVHLFLSRGGIDILEHKTKFMLYSCPISTVSSCAVHPARPKILGFVAKQLATDMYHCYVFQSKKFSQILVSLIGDAFQASRQIENVRGGRDLVVEALRHKNKVLQRENAELKRRLQERGDGSIDRPQHIYENSSDFDSNNPLAVSERSNLQGMD
ncbi:PTB domain-containing engulfment adapter protein 1 [Chanos chanos]|uniref:PTB domain-containing engulfment adapter protein 1 n=1 Tax=Chanos chanos TaxID=29144 RepID=A0A6J2UWC8_CHACN|nr:PTB domain-containing engulfment adapter protein 1-like [Chanos chanos]